MADPQVPESIEVTQKDNLVKLIFTVTMQGRVESLLGATPVFEMIGRKTGNVVQVLTCSVTDPSAAEVTVSLMTEHLMVPDIYQTELHMYYPNGVKLTRRNRVIITVSPEVVAS